MATRALRFLAFCCIITAIYAFQSNTQPPKFIQHTRVSILPLLSPDNSLYELQRVMDSANSTLEIENQYIMKFSRQNWLLDGHPLMQSIVLAHQRGVAVRVLLDGKADSDFAAPFLRLAGVPVRYLRPDQHLHNKAVIVDNSTVVISSINWSQNSLVRNRETGIVMFNASEVAAYYLEAFQYDWDNGNTNFSASRDKLIEFTPAFVNPPTRQFPIFHATINVTAFVNPDNGAAFDLVTKYIAAAKRSIHIQIYSITYRAFAEAVIASKRDNQLVDVSLIISKRRAGYYDTVLTDGNLEKMVLGGVDIYNSSDAFNFQHSKSWIIDSEHLFIHSGNWAGTSLTPLNGTSANRDFGIVIHDKCIAHWFDQNVFHYDLKLTTGQYNPITCPRDNFDKCGICNGDGSSCILDLISFDACGYCKANQGYDSSKTCPDLATAPNMDHFALVAALVASLFFALIISAFSLMYMRRRGVFGDPNERIRLLHAEPGVAVNDA